VCVCVLCVCVCVCGVCVCMCVCGWFCGVCVCGCVCVYVCVCVTSTVNIYSTSRSVRDISTNVSVKAFVSTTLSYHRNATAPVSQTDRLIITLGAEFRLVNFLTSTPKHFKTFLSPICYPLRYSAEVFLYLKCRY